MLKIVALTKKDLYPSERDTPATKVTMKDVAYDPVTGVAIREADIVVLFDNDTFNMLSNRHGDNFSGLAKMFYLYLPTEIQ